MTSSRAQELATWQADLARAGYIAEPALVAALLLMIDLGRPLLLEGDAGVGKTEVAKVLAAVRRTRLIRLQCHEGLDAHADRGLRHMQVIGGPYEASGCHDLEKGAGEVDVHGGLRSRFIAIMKYIEVIDQ